MTRALLAAVLAAPAPVRAPPPVAAPVDVQVVVRGENIDDVCFWVDPDDRARSLMLVTAKDSALVAAVRLVTGAPVASLAGFGRPNNCAVEGDLLLTTDRDPPGVTVHHLPDLVPVRRFGADMGRPEGIDVLTRDGRRLAYVTDGDDASVHVWDVDTGARVLRFPTGFGRGVEPILVDDARGRVFVPRGEKEDRRGIGWFRLDGRLVREFGADVFAHDAEGLALYACGDGGYLVAADQHERRNEFEVFDRATLAHVGTFRLADAHGRRTAATDGIDILQTPLPRFPVGLLAACDGCGSVRPEQVDVVSWERVAAALGLARCPGGGAPAPDAHRQRARPIAAARRR